jgi:hypothetical protein
MLVVGSSMFGRDQTTAGVYRDLDGAVNICSFRYTKEVVERLRHEMEQMKGNNFIVQPGLGLAFPFEGFPCKIFYLQTFTIFLFEPAII